MCNTFTKIRVTSNSVSKLLVIWPWYSLENFDIVTLVPFTFILFSIIFPYQHGLWLLVIISLLNCPKIEIMVGLNRTRRIEIFMKTSYCERSQSHQQLGVQYIKYRNFFWCDHGIYLENFEIVSFACFHIFFVFISISSLTCEQSGILGHEMDNLT